MLKVWPVTDRAAIADSTDSGIDTAMITVERHDPRNSRIIRLVRAAATAPSRTTPEMAPFTNRDWSFSGVILKVGGSCSWTMGSLSLAPWMTARVDAEPVFRMVDSTARAPST